MVNQTLSSKSLILSALRNSSSPLSGEDLALAAGISRTAVWKNIRSLIQSGYNIETFKTGYLLKEDDRNNLNPWEFGIRENNFLHFDSIDSTMNEARKIAEENKENSPTVITADCQTKGKGRGNHQWTSNKGSLAFTMINRNKINQAEEYRITASSLCAAATVLEQLSGKKMFIRWPNDIWSSEGKVCGILDEFNCSGSQCQWINLGIGINFFSRPQINNSDYVFESTSTVTRSQFLNIFIDEFEKQKKIALSQTNELENSLNFLCMDINKTVRLSNGKNGRFNGIDGFGWAKITDETTGETRTFPPGTISFIKTINS